MHILKPQSKWNKSTCWWFDRILSLAQLRVIRIFPPTADALHTSIPLQAFYIPLVATVKVPMCPVDSSRVHTFPVLIPAKVCIKCFIENILIHIKTKCFPYLQVGCSLQFLQQTHFLSNTPMLLVHIFPLEQNFFFTAFFNPDVSVQAPPCRYVALQQVDAGQVEGAVVVVLDVVVLIVVLSVTNGQHRQGPCPGRDWHLPDLQLVRSQMGFSLAIFSSTQAWPFRADEHWRS